MNEPYEPYEPAGFPPGRPFVPLVEHPQGGLVLVLGIVGVFVGVTAPFAWYYGSRAQREGRAAGVVYRNATEISVGRVLGIVFTILTLVAIVFIALVVGVLGFAAWSQS